MVPDFTAELAPAAVAPSADSGWTGLRAADKRERLIVSAMRVFAARGLEAPMHEVAAAAGAGVASVYRIFPSKHELWAAIVIRRTGEVAAAFDAAREAAEPGRGWEALVAVLTSHVADQSPEPFYIEAWSVVKDVPEVMAANVACLAAEERLLDLARAEGRLRADLHAEDLRLLFAGTRAVRRIDPAQVPRLLELMLDAFGASGPAGLSPSA